MLLCDTSYGGSIPSFPKRGGKNRFYRVGLLLPLLLPLLAGCGLRIISEADLDRHCFACQTTGYSQCKAKNAAQAQTLTMEEAEKVLSLIAEKPAEPGKEAQPERRVSPKDSIPLRIEGYKKY